MPIDFGKPTTTRNYSTEFVPDIVNAIGALGVMLDPAYAGTVTAPPTGAKRISGTPGIFQEWNGTSWATRNMGYVLKAGDTMTGSLATSGDITMNGNIRRGGAVYGTLGIRTGGVYGGAGPNSNYSSIVVETNGNSGMSFLGPNTSTQGVRFGDPENNAVGGMVYEHASNLLSFVANGSTWLRIDATSMRRVSSTHASSVIRSETTDSGATTFGQSAGGIELVAAGMNTTSKFTPGVKFGSADTQFTTVGTKFGAAIVGYATEGYDADTDGGMGIAFFTTANAPGANGAMIERWDMNSSGHLLPGLNNTYDIGSSSLRARGMHSVAGDFSGAVSVGGAFSGAAASFSGAVAITGSGTLALPSGLVTRGTFSPTLTNIDDTSALAVQGTTKYIRIGDMMLWFGRIGLTTTNGLGGTAQFRMSLPVASNFAASTDLFGNVTSNTYADSGAQCTADPTNKQAIVTFSASGSGARIIDFQILYPVL